jgi:threonine dehydratase
VADVQAAAGRIAPYLRPTPLFPYPVLSELVGSEIWVKHENHQPVGAFKVRGGVNLVSQLDSTERRRGLITASTGNHGQSIAYAADLFGVKATVCVPMRANPVKVAAIRSFGADIVEHGRDFDDAREHCEDLAAHHGYRYVHSGDEPDLIAGVGTITLEILAQQPNIDAIVVPVGGGSGAAGACIAAQAAPREVEVIAVQSEAAPAAYLSWRDHLLGEHRMETFAEGLATRVAFDLPQRIIRQLLETFVLVSDDEIRAAVLQMIEGTRNLVEPAGAAPLAAAMRLRGHLAGKRVALICTGGNITLLQLADIWNAAGSGAALRDGPVRRG